MNNAFKKKLYYVIWLLFITFFSSGVAMSDPKQPFLLIADPHVLAIVVADNHESLVDLRKSDKLCIGPSPEIP